MERDSVQNRETTRGRTELIASVDNFAICKAVFEKALFVYPNEHLEMHMKSSPQRAPPKCGSRIVKDWDAYAAAW